MVAGTFRDDRFYRLNVFPIDLPPLRERREDIPMLVEVFINLYASKAGKKIRSIDKNTLALLQSHPWPGNIRELQNVIERSVIVCETENFSLDESWLSRNSLPAGPGDQPLAAQTAAREREMIEANLAGTGGRGAGPAGAAAQHGGPPSTLGSKIPYPQIGQDRFNF